MLRTLTWLLRLAVVLPALALALFFVAMGWQVIHDCFGEEAQPVARVSAYIQPVKWEYDPPRDGQGGFSLLPNYRPDRAPSPSRCSEDVSGNVFVVILHGVAALLFLGIAAWAWWVGRRGRAACVGLHLALFGPAAVSWGLAIESVFFAEYPMPAVLAVPMLVVMAVITLVVLRLLGAYRRRAFLQIEIPRETVVP